jgi:hypothetical protein
MPILHDLIHRPRGFHIIPSRPARACRPLRAVLNGDFLVLWTGLVE